MWFHSTFQDEPSCLWENQFLTSQLSSSGKGGGEGGGVGAALQEGAAGAGKRWQVQVGNGVHGQEGADRWSGRQAKPLLSVKPVAPVPARPGLGLTQRAQPRPCAGKPLQPWLPPIVQRLRTALAWSISACNRSRSKEFSWPA